MVLRVKRRIYNWLDVHRLLRNTLIGEEQIKIRNYETEKDSLIDLRSCSLFCAEKREPKRIEIKEKNEKKVTLKTLLGKTAAR